MAGGPPPVPFPPMAQQAHPPRHGAPMGGPPGWMGPPGGRGPMHGFLGPAGPGGPTPGMFPPGQGFGVPPGFRPGGPPMPPVPHWLPQRPGGGTGPGFSPLPGFGGPAAMPGAPHMRPPMGMAPPGMPVPPPGAPKEDSTEWVAHDSEGEVYYYNKRTGVTTWDRPECLKGEIKVSKEPVPISQAQIPGCEDWLDVTLDDGRRYFYNGKTTEVCWEVPEDVKKARAEDERRRREAAEAERAEKAALAAKVAASAAAHAERHRALLAAAGHAPPAGGIPGPFPPALPPPAPPPLFFPPPPNPVAAAMFPGIQQHMVAQAQAQAVARAQAPLLPEEEFEIPEFTEDDIKPASAQGGGRSAADEARQRLERERELEARQQEEEERERETADGFRDLLREKGIAAFSKWDSALPKLAHDARFKAVANHNQRRRLFDAHVKQRADEERREKREVKKQAVDGFTAILDEMAAAAGGTLPLDVTLEQIEAKYRGDPRLVEVERKTLQARLDARMVPALQEEKNRLRERAAAAASEFRELLAEKALSPDLKWPRAAAVLGGDPRFGAVPEKDREGLWRKWAEEELDRAAKDRERSRAAQDQCAADLSALLEEKLEADDASVEALREGKGPLALFSDALPLLEADERFQKVPDALQRERLWARHVERLTGRAPRTSAQDRPQKAAERDRKRQRSPPGRDTRDRSRERAPAPGARSRDRSRERSRERDRERSRERDRRGGRDRGRDARGREAPERGEAEREEGEASPSPPPRRAAPPPPRDEGRGGRRGGDDKPRKEKKEKSGKRRKSRSRGGSPSSPRGEGGGGGGRRRSRSRERRGGGKRSRSSPSRS